MSSLNKEADIILALQALKQDPKLSLQRAAAIYNVPRKTLSRHKEGVPSPCDTMANSYKLSDLKEQKLIEYILDIDS